MMGCGGSRADAIIEPRYHESWTRETESTWLTNTDVEAPLPVGNGKAFEGGLREKRMVTTGTQCGKQTLAAAAAGAAGSGSGCNHHRRPRRSFSDQAGRDPKQKTTTKEAGALSKDAQSVGGGDNEAAKARDER
ncbi:brain and acute leukemia cytoplasmic protein isoform X2 [Syngnathoides biaculeatus]|uniref:brain and acute leukemia cytoplasmic protein isoform X2 n=1 Tax=Syngnathoides biaculeatus TaxID=300417 RepID=UPI002ADE50B4|nr:brain and acute leukemia cytoplasmic protein isoform X2 [Syngnathoides biaculeatus]